MPERAALVALAEAGAEGAEATAAGPRSPVVLQAVAWGVKRAVAEAGLLQHTAAAVASPRVGAATVDGRLAAQVAAAAVVGHRVEEEPHAVEEAGRLGLVEKAVGQHLLLERRRAAVAGVPQHQATLRCKGLVQLGRHTLVLAAAQ